MCKCLMPGVGHVQRVIKGVTFEMADQWIVDLSLSFIMQIKG
jgi:hypothetical protein